MFARLIPFSLRALLKVGFGDYLRQNHLQYLSKIQIPGPQPRHPEFESGAAQGDDFLISTPGTKDGQPLMSSIGILSNAEMN